MKMAGSCLAVLLSMTLCSPVMSQCSGSTLSLTADPYSVKYITSPNHPSVYPTYSSCTWTITSATNVVLSVQYMAIERGYDYTRIYDGTSVSNTQLYTSQSTNQKVVVTSTGQSVFVKFTSDYSLQLAGFNIAYIAVDISLSPSCSLTASSSQNQYAYLTFTSVSGCTRTITAGASNTVKITVPILEDGATVTLTDGASYSVTVSEGGTSTYVGATTTMRVYASSNAVIVYEEVSSGSSGVVVTSATLTYTSICDVSGVTASSSVGQLTSPNYPNQYNNNQYCEVTITASSGSVHAVVDDWNIGNDDYLYIYDGPSNNGYNWLGSSWGIGSTANSTGNNLHLAFSSSLTSTARGFRLNYTIAAATVPTCASTYTMYTATSSQRTIQSPNYPSSYTNNLDVYWLIQKADETDSIVLDLHVFEVEEAQDCMYDKLTIYDGACTTDPELVVVCGYTPSSYLDSSGVYILVRFETDSSVTKTGFELIYYIGQITADEDDEDDDGLALKYQIAIGVVCGVLFLTALVATIVYCQEISRRKKWRAAHPKPPPVAVKTTSQLLTELDVKYRNKMEENKNKTKVKRKPQSKKYVQDESPPKPPPKAPQATPTGLFLASDAKPTPAPLPPGPPPGPPQGGPPPGPPQGGPPPGPPQGGPLPGPPQGGPPPGPPQAPPQSHVMTDDAVYPPPGPSSGPVGAPAMLPGTLAQPGMPVVPPTGVPPPFNYITPAQAREMGTYGQ